MEKLAMGDNKAERRLNNTYHLIMTYRAPKERDTKELITHLVALNDAIRKLVDNKKAVDRIGGILRVTRKEIEAIKRELKSRQSRK